MSVGLLGVEFLLIVAVNLIDVNNFIAIQRSAANASGVSIT